MTTDLTVVVSRARDRTGSDQLIAEALMIPLGKIVRGIFRHDAAQMLLAEQDNLVETLAAYGPHKSLRVGNRGEHSDRGEGRGMPG